MQINFENYSHIVFSIFKKMFLISKTVYRDLFGLNFQVDTESFTVLPDIDCVFFIEYNDQKVFNTKNKIIVGELRCFPIMKKPCREL